MKKQVSQKNTCPVCLTGKRILAGIVWAALVLAGLAGLYTRLTTGHLLAGYGSYVPWGIWVALYLYGAGIAAGVFLVGGFGFLSGAQGFDSKSDLRTTVVLSLAALWAGLMGIGLDLGRMERGARVFLDPNFTSVITLNSWLYTIFMLTAGLAWFLSWQKDSQWMRPLVFLGALICGVFALGSGMFFATVNVKPFWNSGLWPVMTLMSGLATGSAVLLLVRCVSSESPASLRQNAACLLARRVMQGALAGYLILSVLKGMLSTHKASPDLLSQPVLSSFWFQIIIGAVVPLILLISARKSAWFTAALLSIAGMFGGRLDLVLKGQPPAGMTGLQESFEHSSLVFTYQPTVMEWQVAGLMLAFAVAVYVIGQFVNRFIESYFTKSGSRENA